VDHPGSLFGRHMIGGDDESLKGGSYLTPSIADPDAVDETVAPSPKTLSTRAVATQ